MPVSTSFRVRVVAGLSLFVADGMSIDIQDLTNDLLCVYDYRGVSWSLSTPSVSFRGPWNDFRTRAPMSVEHFGGPARLFSIGGLDNSVNAIELNPISSFPISIVPFNTGFTAGMGVGVGLGALTKMFPALPASKTPWPHKP
jgi:hypothetical protein